MSDLCPVCERGDVINAQCQRCGVFIARGSETPHVVQPGRRFPRRADQDRVNKYTDYARTKADK